ncbi:hypothetical protein [uncultured Shewanella sp.]|uniref:hypothetical protein n=1 Tax=uncultured Shewanella sp. TaxID=173975 RepID=UPI0026083146|nr:hypothetical protein [uncultured Shewanella sp.]
MYQKGNLNRIWLVLGALDALEHPTLLNISNAIGMPKPSVNDILKKLLDGQVAGVIVKKIGTEYKIIEWNDFRQEINKIYTNNT